MGDFFSIGTSGDDLSVAQAQFTSLGQKLGMTTTKVQQFTDQLRSLKTALLPNPDFVQSLKVADELEKFVNAVDALIESQPGLGSFRSDPNVLFDPQVSGFNLFYAQLVTASNSLKLNAQFAYEFFSNFSDESKVDAAKFIMLMIDTSQKVAAKKRLSN